MPDLNRSGRITRRPRSICVRTVRSHKLGNNQDCATRARSSEKPGNLFLSSGEYNAWQFARVYRGVILFTMAMLYEACATVISDRDTPLTANPSPEN